MGQKVNPHGMRVGVIKDWDSRWYASNEKVGDLLVEDHKIRVYLKKLLYAAGVSKIEIERSNEVVTIYLHVARPGIVIGKGGEQVEEYRKNVEKLIGGKTVKLLRSVLTEERGTKPGEIVRADKRLLVACGDLRCIEILQLQAENKKAMPAADYLRGNHVETGSLFE